MIRLLLDSKASVNATSSHGTTALSAAIKALPKQHGADPNNSRAIARLLVESNADLRIQDREGRTAIDHALDRGRKDVAEMLKTLAENQQHPAKTSSPYVNNVVTL